MITVSAAHGHSIRNQVLPIPMNKWSCKNAFQPIDITRIDTQIRQATTREYLKNVDDPHHQNENEWEPQCLDGL